MRSVLGASRPRALVRLLPAEAHRVGRRLRREVPLDALRPGDRCWSSREKIPTDGESFKAA